MIAPAIKNRKIEITKGWAEASPILVAVEADDHKKANSIPVKRSFHSFDFILLESDMAFVVVFKIS
ncbi:MAG: hypothetical protein RLZZ540_67 [Bacteroidota bacterium]|jgi:hypothetical protein